DSMLREGTMIGPFCHRPPHQLSTATWLELEAAIAESIWRHLPSFEERFGSVQPVRSFFFLSFACASPGLTIPASQRHPVDDFRPVAADSLCAFPSNPRRLASHDS